MNYYAAGATSSEQSAQVRSGLTKWYATDKLKAADIGENCTTQFLQAAISVLDGLDVVSAEVNASGSFVPPQPTWVPNLAPAPELITGLPSFCDVELRKRTPGGLIANIRVWVPLAWNGRFLATGGMGSVTGPLWFDQPTIRTITMPSALRNGFATAATDAGNRDERFFEWPLDASTGALDYELLRNWAFRSTHDMAVAGKAVIKALHGCAPRYSYYAGCSGGGRQGLAAIQTFDDDFDGVWASDPAVSWTSLWPAALWPALVMKELDNPLPQEKLDAFREAAVAACDGADGLRDGFIGQAEMIDFDPHSIVGQQTAAGPVTSTDAEVMQKAWDGPRRANGERLGFGLPPGTNGGGMVGIWKTDRSAGALVPVANEGQAYFRWVLEDANFDWRTLDFARFEALTDLGRVKLSEIACDDPDLRNYRDAGGKLIISQAVNDPVIPYRFVTHYYDRVAQACGGLQETQSFARLFCSDGDIHGTVAGDGPGLTPASAMAALMRWVEDGEAPEEIIAERVDIAAQRVAATRPCYPYPAVTRYRGSGDPAKASSYFRSAD